jgi:GDP-D-mannose dehydratase
VFSSYNLNWKDHVEIDPNLIRKKEKSVSAANPMKIKRVLNWEAQTKFRGVIDKLVTFTGDFSSLIAI